jgi:hypothetical protein
VQWQHTGIIIPRWGFESLSRYFLRCSMTTKYHKIKLADGSTKDEHRLLMEQSLSRPLGRREVVHHLNGNTRDNSLDNLIIMDIGAHARLHLTHKGACSVVGCNLPHHAKGYCRKHWCRVQRTGDINGLRGHSSKNPHCDPSYSPTGATK